MSLHPARAFLFALVLAWLVAGTALASPPEGLYYTVPQGRVPLRTAPGRVAVRLEGPASQAAPLRGCQLLEGQPGDFQARSDVRWVSPLLETPGGPALLTDEVLVRFRKEASPSEVASVLQRFQEVPKEFLAERSHLVRVATTSGLEALDRANELAGLPLVEYAHPNFLVLPGSEAPAGVPDRPVAPRGPATWTTVVDEDFSGPFPGPGWTLTGEPTWGAVDLGNGQHALWPAAGGPGAVPHGRTPEDLDAVATFGPFDLSDAVYARMVLRFDETRTEWDTEFFTVSWSTDGVQFNELTSHGLAYHPVGLKASFNQPRGQEPGPDLLPGDLRGQRQVFLRIRYQTRRSWGSPGAYLKRFAILKSTRRGPGISADPLSGLQWHLCNTGQTGGFPGADIRAVDAWRRVRVDPDLVVAVLDTGVDPTHEDLVVLPGYDATGQGGGGAPSANQGHGTSCAGLVGAVGNNGLGVIGVAPGVRILPVRVTNPAAEYTAADIAAGIRWASQHGARVLSNSWTWQDFPELHEAIRDAAASGAVVVFAAGNLQGNPVAFPARYPECIAVGSSNQCDGPKRIDDESLDLYGHCSGPELSVVAPGTSMVTTDLMGEQGYSGDNYTASFNGTSSACPVVAGVVALMLSKAPGLTPGQVREILQRTADDLAPVPLVGQPVDELVGYGRVNADAALAALEVLGAGSSSSEAGGGGCFIATAAWGSAFHPQVATLRRFRDEHLLTHAPGRAFTALYYRLSPPVARFLAPRPLLRAAVRAGLTPLVAAVRHPGPAGALALLSLTSALAAWRRRAARRRRKGSLHVED